MAAQGKTMEDCKAEMAGKSQARRCTGRSCWRSSAALIMAWALYGVLLHLNTLHACAAGMISGGIIWFGFVLTTMTVNNAFHGRQADADRDRQPALARRRC